MASVASFGVSVFARTDKFVKGMKKARKSVGGFSASVKAAGKKLAMFALNAGKQFGMFAAAAAAAGSAVAAALTLITKQAMTAIDAMAKTSDKLDIDIEKLAGLHLAAKLAGVKVRVLEMGMQRMARRMAEAAIGTGEAKGAIAELGIHAAKVSKLPVEEKMRVIADAMEKVTDQSTRLRLGFKLFDSEGVALINVLRGGRKALDETQESAERLGLTFSRLAAANVEDANNAIVRLKAMLEGLGRTLAVRLSVYITHAAEKLEEFATAGEGVGGRVETGMQVAIDAMSGTASAIEILAATFYGLRAAVTGVFAGIAQAYAGLFKVLSYPLPIKGISSLVSAFADELSESAKADAQMFKSLMEAATGDTRFSVSTFIREAKEAANKKNELRKELEGKGRRGMPRVAESPGGDGGDGVVDDASSSIERFAKGIWQATRTPLEKFAAHMRKLTDALHEGALSWETYFKAVDQAKDTLFRTSGGLARANAKIAALWQGALDRAAARDKPAIRRMSLQGGLDGAGHAGFRTLSSAGGMAGAAVLASAGTQQAKELTVLKAIEELLSKIERKRTGMAA